MLGLVLTRTHKKRNLWLLTSSAITAANDDHRTWHATAGSPLTLRQIALSPNPFMLWLKFTSKQLCSFFLIANWQILLSFLISLPETEILIDLVCLLEPGHGQIHRTTHAFADLKSNSDIRLNNQSTGLRLTTYKA